MKQDSIIRNGWPEKAEEIIYNPRRHSARKTRSYLFNQVIPYIGNKRKLLPLIYDAIRATDACGGTFFDVFSGSGVVSRLAKTLGFRVISNDWEPYSFHINTAFIRCNRQPNFQALGIDHDEVFKTLNNAEPLEGYITAHYCPSDDSKPDPRNERMFFTRENGMRIDAMREMIEDWWRKSLISNLEKSYILGPLIYSVSYVSNTSGVFKAYHQGWGGSTRTALYRILSRVDVRPPVLYDNGHENIVLCENALEILPEIEAEITYIDPPYNQHQYGSNYHLLNTVALWDKPPLNRKVIVGGKTVNKSAIRLDWRNERKSLFCYRETALDEMEKVLELTRSRWVLVSYSTDGIIPADKLLELASAYGLIEVKAESYKRYRVSSQRYSPRPRTVEYVVILRRSGIPSSAREGIRLIERLKTER